MRHSRTILGVTILLWLAGALGWLPLAGLCTDARGASAFSTTFWVNTEYLLWLPKDSPMPVQLLTTGPEADPLPELPGLLNTETLFGGQPLDYPMTSGMRIEGGWWFSSAMPMAIEAGFFKLGERSTSYHGDGGENGQVFLGEPFFDANTGTPGFFPVSGSLGMTGVIDAQNSIGIWGWEANLAVAAYGFIGTAAHGLIGFRSVGVDEDLSIDSTIWNLEQGGGATFLGTSVDPSDRIQITDRFHAHNRFYGPQLGARLLWEVGPFMVTLLGKVAVGVSQELVIVEGASTLARSDSTLASAAGGVYAQASNMGRYFENEFAMVPEGRIDIGYNLSQNIQIHIGYTFLYWSNVVRPGDVVDPTINPAIVPTSAGYNQAAAAGSPSINFNGSDFWAQGGEVGLTVRF
jgi:hypothetical protein